MEHPKPKVNAKKDSKRHLKKICFSVFWQFENNGGDCSGLPP
jgi:hypothetical protein